MDTQLAGRRADVVVVPLQRGGDGPAFEAVDEFVFRFGERQIGEMREIEVRVNGVCTCSPNSAGSTTPPSLLAAADLTACSNSRTLPGQAWASKPSIAAGENCGGAWPLRWAA